MTERGSMRILVVNDDGIRAEGIERLARMAAQLGEVWVVAPKEQCSAMSHRITVFGEMVEEKVDFPVAGVQAYSISGTPADCVKIGLEYILPEKPDVVFSGINYGFNVGFDILYSGTIGAAMEALLNGVPAIAYSSDMNGVYEVVEEKLLPITKELLRRSISKNEIWNVNFPGCTMSELKGILEDRIPEQGHFYLNKFIRTELENGGSRLIFSSIPNPIAKEGTDMRAVHENYISIGRVRSSVLF
jgi:5'-nucleotidase